MYSVISDWLENLVIITDPKNILLKKTSIKYPPKSMSHAVSTNQWGNVHIAYVHVACTGWNRSDLDKQFFTRMYRLFGITLCGVD